MSGNESGFKIQRFSNSVWTQVGTTAANVTSWGNGGLSASTTYTYRVMAYNASGDSLSSNQASATTQALSGPSTPTASGATSVTSSSFTANWTSASGATGYQLDVSGNSAFSSYVTGYPLNVGNVVSWGVGGLSANTTYYYRVRATNANGTSSNSNIASVTTSAAADTTAPTVPSGLTATAASASQINLSWAAATDSGGSGLAGYRVYQSGSQVASTAATTYAQPGLSTAIQYCFTVAAYDNAGNVSAQSTQACAVTQSVTSSQPWSKAFGSTTNDSGQAVAFDSTGNVYMTGYFQGTVNFGCGSLTSNGSSYPDVFLAKYSVDGTCVWSKRFGGSLDDAGYGVAVDGNDNVIVAGYFSDTANFGGGAVTVQRGYNVFVAKYAADGTYQWAKSVGSVDGGMNKAYAVAADRSGNVAITGTFQNTVDFGGGTILPNATSTNIFVAEYSAAGAHLWSRGFGSTNGDFNSYGRGITIDGSGNVIATGHFWYSVNFGCGTLTSAGGDDIFVAKYSATGACQWSRQYGDASDQQAMAVAADSTGNIAIAGMFKGTLNFGGSSLINTYFAQSDIFVVRLTSSGAHSWSKSFGSTSADQARAVAMDSSGNVIMTGLFTGQVDFGGGALTSSGLTAFVAKYSAAGAHQWSKAFAGTGSNQGNGVGSDKSGNVGVSGYFQGSVDFGQGSFANAGGLDAFLLKLAP